MIWIDIAGTLFFGVLFLFGLHRLAEWMEDRGWIYYRKSRGMSSRLGSAFLEIQKMLEPQKKYVIEARTEVREQMEVAGADPQRNADNTDRIQPFRSNPDCHPKYF